MKRIECVVNFNKRNKIKAKLKNPACVINFCCDKVVMLPLLLIIQVTLCFPLKVSEWIMYCDWQYQAITRKTRPLPATLAAQCHQLCNQQKLYKPHPTKLTITDHRLYFFKTRFVTSSSYLLHHSQLTLKATGFAGNFRNRFSSDQCKDILPVCGRLSMKKTTPSLILLSLLRKKISFLCPHP